MTNKSCLLIFMAALPSCIFAGDLRFDTTDHGAASGDVPQIAPWKAIALDRDYGGQWVLAADLDADGRVELVSCENHNANDVHYTSTAVAHELDGSVIWKWGDPHIGRKNWHHDVACQIHDLDGDGEPEVFLATKGAVVELDGQTGQERRRVPIPDDATDCLVFCNLTSKGRPTDILVKNRYHQIWAYDSTGKLLWTVKDPGGYRTAHQPSPIDLDGDGIDEIAAGYAMLNADGSVRWVFQSTKVDQNRGHLDCIRVATPGDTPKDFRLVLTTCGANSIAMIDGRGKTLWELAGHHFESIDIGKVLPNHRDPQILVDIDHQPMGESPMWVIDAEGKHIGRITADYCRHHALLDWTGDELDEIIVAHSGAVYGQKGVRIATLAIAGRDPEKAKKGETSLLIGDMTGDGVPDATLVTTTAVYIYKNENGRKPPGRVPLGTEFNFSLY